jgi:DNA-nicking Smr family endonuclease
VRKLSPEEAELWARVTASIRPLSRELPAKAEVIVQEAVARPVPPPIARKPKGPPPRYPAPAAKVKPPIGGTLDGGWDRRLRSGSAEPDRVLDLHGHRLDEAWEAIDRALERAILNHERLVLLITGHERPGEPPVERGRIRAAVHDWLAVSRHQGRIAAVRGAHRRHGGGGSLYIILRR